MCSEAIWGDVETLLINARKCKTERKNVITMLDYTKATGLNDVGNSARKPGC